MDAHATLMEAIRKAGGSGKAHLRSAADRKIEAKRQKQVSLDMSIHVQNFMREEGDFNY